MNIILRPQFVKYAVSSISRFAQSSAAKTVMGISLGAFALLIASPAQATLISLTTADGLGADTFLNGGEEILPASGLPRRDSNFGDRINLSVQFQPDGSNSNDLDEGSRFTRIALLRFDLSSVTGTITAATLRLSVGPAELDNRVTITLNQLPDGEALDGAPADTGWEELAITMANSRLANQLPIVGVGGNNTIFPGDLTAEYTGNSLLNAVLSDNNDLITFVIMPLNNSTNPIQLFSKESGDSALFPTLELTVIDNDPPPAVPEPGTFALFGIGLGGLGFIRRRRNSA